MPSPCRVLQIFSDQSALSDLDCFYCEGQGGIRVFDPETGHELQDCPHCQGSGYNLLGLIIRGLLQPPQGGYGPQALQDILRQPPASASRANESAHFLPGKQEGYAHDHSQVRHQSARTVR
ncbi:hypothetical protein [Vampirovibrio sp.]|uniref:hypothetical protein n=1 Tax=Vampirovibrio sp. TaxID=2717857 RepID=UPI0035946650